MKTPHYRYSRDVMGMPCFAATEKLLLNISADDMTNAVAADDENCAIALACKRQLQSPYTSIGRSRSDVALPHPQGVVKPNHGDTKWAVVRFHNPRKAREIIVAADTESLIEEGTMLELTAPHKGLIPTRENYSKHNEHAKKSFKNPSKKRRSGDELTDMGVRILTGQRFRG